MRLLSRLAIAILLSSSASAQSSAPLVASTSGRSGSELAVMASSRAPAQHAAGDEVGPQGGEPGSAVLPVPEPSTLLLVGTGLVGLAFTVRRRKRPTG